MPVTSLRREMSSVLPRKATWSKRLWPITVNDAGQKKSEGCSGSLVRAPKGTREASLLTLTFIQNWICSYLHGHKHSALRSVQRLKPQIIIQNNSNKKELDQIAKGILCQLLDNVLKWTPIVQRKVKMMNTTVWTNSHKNSTARVPALPKRIQREPHWSS